MKKFLLLASVALGGSIQAVMLHQFNFFAAGVLPVTNFNGKQYAILSREAGGNDKGTYDDFGGKRDPQENDSLVTAAREFSEEAISGATFGMNAHAARQYLAQNSQVITNNSNVLYITRFSENDIRTFRKKFHPARAKSNNWKYQEKDRIATVRWDRLKNAILSSHSNTGVKVEARLIDPHTGQEKGHNEMITLRPFLVKKLRPVFQIGGNAAPVVPVHKPQQLIGRVMQVQAKRHHAPKPVVNPVVKVAHVAPKAHVKHAPAKKVVKKAAKKVFLKPVVKKAPAKKIVKKAVIVKKAPAKKIVKVVVVKKAPVKKVAHAPVGKMFVGKKFAKKPVKKAHKKKA